MYLKRILVALTIGAQAAALSACGEAPGQSQAGLATTVPVEVSVPLLGSMTTVYSGTATLEADAEATVVAKVAGELQSLAVQEGDRVIAGQVLARLDRERLQLQAEQTAARLHKIERDYRRQVDLHEKGLIATGAFEGLKYDLEAERAAYELAHLELSYAQVRAPIAGVVSARLVKRGAAVKTNDALFRITDLDPLIAYIYVPERELSRSSPESAQPSMPHRARLSSRSRCKRSNRP
jgi:membrane fusion protein, multidrug efflux system